MKRVLYEFERGKGLLIDLSSECVAYLGPRFSLLNRKPVPGLYRPGRVRAAPLVAIFPDRHAPPDRKDHARLRMRERIGHSFKGWPRNPDIRKSLPLRRDGGAE